MPTGIDPTLESIVKDWLDKTAYAGLRNDDIGCECLRESIMNKRHCAKPDCYPFLKKPEIGEENFTE
jgi:hypothetical protein